MTANSDPRIENTDAQIRHVFEAWHEAVTGRDLDGLMALYAEDAVLETPLILVALADRTAGVLKGKAEIRPFFEAGFRKLGNSLNRWHRTGVFFSNGRQLTWEYPRVAPHGDQMDVVEVMDLADELITHHRVYWGWMGFRTLLAALRERT